MLATTEGIFTEPAGGTTLAATIKLLHDGVIGRDDVTVICITGNGYKSVDAIANVVEQPTTLSRSLQDFEQFVAQHDHQ